MDITTGGASADSSGYVDASGSIATREQRLHMFATRERGSNYEFADGKVKPTRYERNNLGGGYGFRRGQQEFSLDLRRNETDPSGTPSLPMDIIDINTTMAQGEYRGKLNGYALHGQIYWSDINHKMSNYELREPPPGMMPSMPPMTRLTNATSSGSGYRFDTGFTLGPGTLMLGTDGHLAEHNSTVVDPVNNPAFRLESFNNVRRDVYGLFAEWNGAIDSDWTLLLGARYNRVDMNAGDVFSSMMTANALQTRFNNADRSKTDDNLDLMAKLVHALSSRLSVEIEAGRKTRSPSYQERYLWLPLEATNGLADGNTYVGDINLDPEVAYEIDTGFDWHTAKV